MYRNLANWLSKCGLTLCETNKVRDQKVNSTNQSYNIAQNVLFYNI